MTEDEFRTIALRVGKGGGAVEGSHMGNADFRVVIAGKNGKEGGKVGRIFATLPFVDDDADAYGVVMLTPEEQAAFIAEADVPGVFEPVKGKWGLQGATMVRLKKAGKRVVKKAVEAAWIGKGGKV